MARVSSLRSRVATRGVRPERESSVTENSTFKKAVRARAAQTGEKYTEARRNLLAESAASSAAGIEPHYLFLPPRSIQYVDAQSRRDLSPPPEAGPDFSWGYAGTGPSTSAWAVLLDATGSADLHLAIAFTTDHLAWWEEIGEQQFAITAAEVTAWRHENETRVRAEAATKQRTVSPAEMEAMILDHLATGPAKPWWQTYRGRHGEPRLT